MNWYLIFNYAFSRRYAKIAFIVYIYIVYIMYIIIYMNSYIKTHEMVNHIPRKQPMQQLPEVDLHAVT